MESDTFKSRPILLPSDTLFTLLEKQAKEFETFGKRMSLEVQNAYKTYIQEQMQNELSKTSNLDNILEKQQILLESQSKFIDSLRSRIEELENDSVKKNHEIKVLKNEFLDFKKEIKLLFGLEKSSQSFDHNNNFKKGNSLYEGNDSDEFEFIHSESKYVESLTASNDIIRQNDIINNDDNNLNNIRPNGSNERLIAENNQSNEIDIKNERLIFKNIQPKVVYGINQVLPIPTPKDQNVENMVPIVENKKTSIFGSVLFDEYFYNHSTFTDHGDHGESSASAKSSPNNNFDTNDRKSNMVTNGRGTVDFVLQQPDETTDQDNKVNSSSDVSKDKESEKKILVEDHIKEESTEESLSDQNMSEEELEEDIKYNPAQRSLQDPNKNLKSTQKLRDLLLDLKASELGSQGSNSTNKIHDAFGYITKTSAFQQKDNISCLPPVSINPLVITASSSTHNKVQGSQKTPTVIEQIQAEVQYTISHFREQNTRIKQKTFNYLLNQFALDSLIKYQETVYYNALARDPKRSIKLMVKTALRSELCNKDKRVSQPIEEYVKRKIIPSLPSGIRSYAEYEKSSYFAKLSDEKKKRIRKIVSVE